MNARAYFQDTRIGAAATTQRMNFGTEQPPRLGTYVPPGYGQQRYVPTGFEDTARVEQDLAVQHGWTGGPDKPKKTRGRVVLLVLASLLFSVLVGGALNALTGSADGETPAPSLTSMPVKGLGQATSTAQPGREKPPATVAGIGDTVKIESLQYRVHSVKCGISLVGSKDFGATPQGEFCRIDLSVANQGSKPRFWDSELNVKAKDAKGREFSPDGTAGMFGNKNAAGFLDEINPGNTVRAFVFFDLPKGADLTKLELTAGMFGDSAQVKL